MLVNTYLKKDINQCTIYRQDYQRMELAQFSDLDKNREAGDKKKKKKKDSVSE